MLKDFRQVFAVRGEGGSVKLSPVFACIALFVVISLNGFAQVGEPGSATSSPTSESRATKSVAPFSLASVVDHANAFLRPTPAQPFVFDFVMDASLGSPGGEKKLFRPSVAAVAELVAAIPGSTVRFWAVGDSASTTRILGAATVGQPKSNVRQALQAHRAREVASILGVFDGLMIPVPRQSPLFASLTRVAQETTPNGARRFILFVSDLREHSELGDQECHTPSVAPWTTALQRERLLLPHSLDGIFLIGVHTGLRPVYRNLCTATVAHRDAVVSLWATVTSGAGAHFVPLTGNITKQMLTEYFKGEQQ